MKFSRLPLGIFHISMVNNYLPILSHLETGSMGCKGYYSVHKVRRQRWLSRPSDTIEQDHNRIVEEVCSYDTESERALLME